MLTKEGYIARMGGWSEQLSDPESVVRGAKRSEESNGCRGNTLHVKSTVRES